MSEWITASGEAQKTDSNLAETNISHAPQVVVGTMNNLEVTGTGPVIANAPAEYTLGQEAVPEGDVMATVQSHSGGGIYGRNPSGKDTVDIGGYRTNIDTAVGMGLLVRNGDGTYSNAPQKPVLKDPTDAAPKVGEKATNEVEPQGVSFGEAGDAVMQELIAGQNPGDLFKTVDSILQFGEMNQQTLERMASTAQVEPADMAEKVATVWAGVQEAAEDYLFEAGVDNQEAFEAFLSSNPQHQQNMIEAARNFFVYHKTEGLATMAEAYLPQMDKFDTDNARRMLTEAGYQFEDKPDGGLFVFVDGMKVSWEVAVKQKAITFSKA